MKAILLHSHSDDGQASRLQAAIALAHMFQGSVHCLHVTPLSGYVATEPFGGMYVVGALYDELVRQAHENRGIINGVLAKAHVPYTWLGADTEIASSIVAGAALADILVVSQLSDAARSTVPPLPLAADAAIHARSPVLVVPVTSETPFDPFGAAIVAWNGTTEAAHALRAALPLLLQAPAVTLLSVGTEDEQIPIDNAIAYLALHDVKAAKHSVPHDQRTVAATIIDEAVRTQAGYVVMGAYGHARWREAILGGVTRSMLADCPVPLLLAR